MCGKVTGPAGKLLNAVDRGRTDRGLAVEGLEEAVGLCSAQGHVYRRCLSALACAIIIGGWQRINDKQVVVLEGTKKKEEEEKAVDPTHKHTKNTKQSK
jgi:hypothetical protein